MTGISYVNETVNCVTGCTKRSPGCQNCYALAMSYRLERMDKPQYWGVVRRTRPIPKIEWTGQINFDIEPLRRVLKWRKPKRIFLNSMSDTFHPGVTDEQIGEMWKIMFEAKQHTFLVLTKRPEQMRELVGGVEWAKDLLSHIWLGVTVENQAMADERIPILLQTPAKVRWLSVEPMLGEISLHSIPGNRIPPYRSFYDLTYDWGPGEFDYQSHRIRDVKIDWVVIGCESGVNRRPCKLEWVRSLVAECIEAQVPVWVKQLEINGKVVQDVSKFPADLKIRELPNG